jgi:hypothetical protein
MLFRRCHSRNAATSARSFPGEREMADFDFAAKATTDRSGTITTGGTAQTLMAANTGRRGFSVQNLSSGDLWISDVGTAAASQPSMKILPDQVYESALTGVPRGAISIYGATTGQAFMAREW